LFGDKTGITPPTSVVRMTITTSSSIKVMARAFSCVACDAICDFSIFMVLFQSFCSNERVVISQKSHDSRHKTRDYLLSCKWLWMLSRLLSSPSLFMSAGRPNTKLTGAGTNNGKIAGFGSSA